MGRINAFYSRRIVNVNVNVVVAGLFAMGITVLVMHSAQESGLLEHLKGIAPDINLEFWGKPRRIQGQKLVISGLTFIVDLVADVAVYYGLHWVANHMPRRTAHPKTSVAYADLSFMRDASLVQFERAILSPLLYVVALSLQNTLLHNSVSLAAATAIGFTAGITTSRLAHTLWMMINERRAIEKLKTSPTPTSGV